MGLSTFRYSANRRSTFSYRHAVALSLCAASLLAQPVIAQSASLGEGAGNASSRQALQVRSYLNSRMLQRKSVAAEAMNAARRQQAFLLTQQASAPNIPLDAAWHSVGPAQVASVRYGNITGRITSIAIDPADTSGNTVYLGTLGGGVWKSTNAAGAPASVTFAPLTDTLPVFNANAGSSAMPSLSIGAVSVQSGVVLAGTGDPNDAIDSFYGSGILRSMDGGLTWTLIQQSNDGSSGNHSFTGLSFSGFAWSSSSPGTVVAAVSQAAEGVLVNAPDAANSVMGIYYSTDAGVTWKMSTIMDGSQIVQHPLPTAMNQGGNAATSVVWNPIRQRFYAAIRYHGYYESPDGVIWTRLAHQPGTGLSLTACPTNPDGIGNVSCPMFRGVLAVQPLTGDTFALSVDRNNLDQGLWQDVCGLSGANCASNTVTFTRQLPSTPLETTTVSTVIPQADYDLSLAAVPSGADTLLYAGTIDLYRCSLAAGCTLRNTTNATNGCAAPAMVAPAQHAIAALANSTLLYIGNDGGIWRSVDGVNQQTTPCSPDDAIHFQNLNSGLGSLAEVTSFAQHPTDPETLLAGLGANGTAATSAASASTAWPQISIGEGGTVAIDQADPLLWYVSTGAGVSIRRCANGAACAAADFNGPPTIGAAQTAVDFSLIDAPWLLDPALPSNLLIGTCRVWRGPADDGAQWSSSNAISKLLGGPQNAACSSTNPMVRSLAAAGPVGNAVAAQNAGSKILYAGMTGTLDGGGNLGGHVFSTTTADTASNSTLWTDLALSPVTNDAISQHKFNPGGFDISSLAADPHDPTGKTIYATVMGFKVPHLYRSIDGGANWTNISGNLPDAPANSVLVDPNDANTLYVALDTGVYITTQVSTCASDSCWSIYGTNLPNAPVIQLAASPAMPTGDGRTGELRAATYGRGIWQIPLLTASGPAQPAMSLSSAALTFDAQAVATVSTAQTVTVTNTGSAPLTIHQIATTGDYTETDDCISASIAVGLTCKVQVRFLPTATGSRTGLLTISGNVPGGQATASLSGNGTPEAAIILNPVILTFPSTGVNSTSAAQNITISNTGSAAIALQSPRISGTDFQISTNTCGLALAASTGCTVAVTFTPTATGTRAGTFTIADGAGTQTASLSGTGALPATDALSASSLSFAPQQLATTSASQQITITNSGGVPLTLLSAQITSGDFAVANACGNSLNPHSTCAINVTFQPQSLGTDTGVLTILDQYRTQTIALSGTGVAPAGVSLSPFYTLAFPATGVGQTALPQTVTLTNNSGVALHLQSADVTGDFSIVPGSDTCGAVVAANTACTMQIVFTPTTGGARTGTLTITDDAPNSPQVLRLSGTALNFALSPDGNTTVTIASGQNAVFPLLFTSSSALSGTVAFTCAGAPLNATCRVTPSSAPLSGTATISVVVLTGTPSTSLALPPYPGQSRTLWFAALLPLGLFALRRARLPRLACLVVLCCALFPMGCGAGRQLPSSGSSGTSPAQLPVTPAGTYPILVSATSAGFTQTIKLTLIVQ